MFLIGDILYYPSYGAGCVINIEEKEVLGEIKKYYIIMFVINKISIMVPVNSSKTTNLRKAISIEECNKVYEILNSDKKNLPVKWIDRYKYYTKNMNNGDIYNMGEILRDIAYFSRIRKISKGESKMFFDILNLVCSELSLVLQREFEELKLEVLDIVKFNRLNC